MTADLNLVLCTAQNVFGNGTAVYSTDWIDFKVAQDNAAGGKGPVLEVRVTTSFAGGTSAQFQVAAVDAAGANPVVLDELPPTAVAGLTAGKRFVLRMSPKLSLPASTLTHLRLRVLNVGNNTAGAVSAVLVEESNSAAPGKDYASGY